MMAVPRCIIRAGTSTDINTQVIRSNIYIDQILCEWGLVLRPAVSSLELSNHIINWKGPLKNLVGGGVEEHSCKINFPDYWVRFLPILEAT
jgi:hypothetical protein